MATENNWITSSIADRLTDKGAAFTASVNPFPFTEMEFHDAADYTAKKITSASSKPLYLALSGGYDSDYVLHAFMRNNLPIIPIIVRTSGNEAESQWAINLCDHYMCNRVIIGLSDVEVLQAYFNSIYSKLNGSGIHSVAAVVAGQWANNEGGNLIIGEHVIGGDYDGERACEVNEWDFYNDALLDNVTYPFFMYTPELTYAMVKRIEQGPADEWKHRLYGTPHRKMHRYEYNELFMSALLNINKKRAVQPLRGCSLGTKDEFLERLLPYVQPK